ncbi:MAG TPA: Trm112 family protein [Gammaproteobacteria bacterium]|nr:Trm112 family protein [Gammaproteobacteria bacterium]
MIDKALLKLLVCPKSKAPLKQVGDELVCEVSGLAYPINDGIPVLLIEEARKIS